MFLTSSTASGVVDLAKESMHSLSMVDHIHIKGVDLHVRLCLYSVNGFCRG